VPIPKAAEAVPSPNAVYDEVRAVRDLVDQVIGVLTYTAQDPAVIQRREADLRSFFGKGTRRREVYLALDKELNISEVAAALGMKRQNVSTEINRMHEAGLVVPVRTGGRGDVWIPNPIIESVVRLSRRLRSWAQEPAQGAPEKQQK
jgi:hypothetical protein